MPLPRGVEPEHASFGYIQALQGFSVEAITHGIRRFLRGECEGVNMRFCPHPPELAAIIRNTVHSAPDKKRFYLYRQPKSKQIERGVTKEYGRQLVDSGIHPRGSIWLPGDPESRPDIGDVYAPDPDWKLPVRADEKPDVMPHEMDGPEVRIRMGFKMALLSKALSLRMVEKVRQANERGLEDLMALAQEWGVPIPESLWTREQKVNS